MSAFRSQRWLFVCTANINRSPMALAWAERVLSSRFVTAELDSAGSHGWDDGEAGAFTIDAMRGLDFDLRDHRSKPLSPALLAWADYVVVMEERHADVALGLDPDCGPKIRRLWHFQPDGGDHVVDPHNEPLEAHREAAQVIGVAVTALIQQVFAERRAAREANS